MNRAAIIGTLVVGVAVMTVLSVFPAMALHSNPDNVLGQVVFINKADKHGMIEHVVLEGSASLVGDGTLYQYRIPQDFQDPNDSSTIPEVGDFVQFSIDPENSRHATNVRIATSCPPNCGSGGGFG
ncbi:MAG: hypothetical protein ACE5RJ_01510 [Nitrosopumilaceae archaeon]